MADPTFRTCEVMQELSYYEGGIEVLQALLEDFKPKRYAFILHDKDVDEGGKPKATHFHCILEMETPRHLSTISKALAVPPQYINKIKTTTRKAYEYLIHKNDPSKHPYDATEVVANFDYVAYIESGENASRDKDYWLNEVLAGNIPEWCREDIIDPLYLAKNRRKVDDAFTTYNEIHRSINRDMKIMFLSGDSGTGKTTLAKLMGVQYLRDTCSRKDLNFEKGLYVSAGGDHPLDGYSGQPVCILDDLRDSVYRLSELLKMTDNHTNSEVAARYHNKDFSHCELLIITSIQPLDNWYLECKAEPKEQFFRRICEWLEVTTEKVVTLNYSRTRSKWVEVDAIVNPVPLIHKAKALSSKGLAGTLLSSICPEEVFSPEDENKLPF